MTRLMMIPVRCDGCRAVYDLCDTTITERYADCTRWKAPCCGRQCDDRPRGWGGEGYTELKGIEKELHQRGRYEYDAEYDVMYTPDERQYRDFS